MSSAQRQFTSATPDATFTPQPLAVLGTRRWRGVLTEAPLTPEPHVRILTEDGRELHFRATYELAQQVFHLRGAQVVAMCTRGEEHPRAISLHAADEVPAPPDPDAFMRAAVKRWAKTLEILAR